MSGSTSQNQTPGLARIISSGPIGKGTKFGKGVGLYQHNLHTNPMFDDAGLASLLDVFPREKLGVYTMGHDAKDHKSWQRGSDDGLTGAQLLDATKTGRLWLSLRWTNKYVPGYQQLVDRMFGELHQMHPGLTTFKHDFGLVISSPNAQDFYHIDIPLVALWQVRGTRHMHIWPPKDPYVREADLERAAHQNSHEIFDYNPVWDQDATNIDLKPGMMVTWPQNAPHRTVNGDMLNVSLSIDFMTPGALFLANLIYGNGVMRKRFNMPQRLQDGFNPQNIAKVGLAKMAKKLNWYPQVRKEPPVTFKVAASAPNCVQDIPG